MGISACLSSPRAHAPRAARTPLQITADRGHLMISLAGRN